LDLEEAIGWTESLDPLMRPLVVIIFDPEFDALTGVVEAVELGAVQKLLPDAFPETLDFAESHGMMRTGLEVGHPVLLQLRFEAGSAAPGSILSAIIGEHLLGRFELTNADPIDFDDRLCRRAAEQIGGGDEARVIIHESNQVGIASAQAEGEDVGLPHLVGGGPLEKARASEVACFGGPTRFDQPGLVQMLAHRFRTGLHEEATPQPVGDALDAKGGVLLFEFHDLLGDRRRQLELVHRVNRALPQALFAQLAIDPCPVR
jgi:hypothetical protein